MSEQGQGYRQPPVRRVVAGTGQVRATPPPAPGLKAREGDVLTVSYPEVAIPTPVKFLNIHVGGLSVQRVLREGEDFGEVYDTVYSVLRERAERDAAAKRDYYFQRYGNLGG